LETELFTNNTRLSGNYNESFRMDYFNLYEYILQDLYVWGINEHRQSEVILPLKKFLTDVLPAELQDAKAAGSPPAVGPGSSINLIRSLAQLYYDMGNAEQANEVIMQGWELVENAYSENDFLH